MESKDVKRLFNSRTHTFQKGQMLYFLGEIPKNSFYINEGYIKVYAVSEDGSEQIVRFCGPGEFLALGWLFGYSSVIRFYYQALTDCSAEVIFKEEFEKEEQNPELLRSILDQLNIVANLGLVRNMALQQIKARQKIIYFLYFLSLRYGKEIGNSLYAIKIPMTHQTIAENLGLTRETVSTEMSKLKKESLIVVRQKKYIIDKKVVVSIVGREISNFHNAIHFKKKDK
ncbi:MAG: Crp/Fnr family transcriptional regulator [Patescibacteria group bacterium]